MYDIYRYIIYIIILGLNSTTIQYWNIEIFISFDHILILVSLHFHHTTPQHWGSEKRNKIGLDGSINHWLTNHWFPLKGLVKPLFLRGLPWRGGWLTSHECSKWHLTLVDSRNYQSTRHRNPEAPSLKSISVEGILGKIGILEPPPIQ